MKVDLDKLCLGGAGIFIKKYKKTGFSLESIVNKSEWEKSFHVRKGLRNIKQEFLEKIVGNSGLSRQILDFLV